VEILAKSLHSSKIEIDCFEAIPGVDFCRQRTCR